jgi:membrane protein YdbS with pleckstrin-like domain
MAALRVDTAGATRTGHSVDIPYLDTAVASGLVDRLYAEAGRTAFRW